MVAGQDDGRVFIPRLLLAPFDEFGNLIVRTPDDICVLLRELVAAQFADISFRIVRVNGQQGKCKRRVLGRQVGQAVFCECEQFLIFEAPPDFIITGQFSVCRIVLPVVEVIVPVLCKAQSSSAECGIRSETHVPDITIRLKDISQADQIREERILCVHEVGTYAIDLNRNLQRKPGGCGKHAAHGPGTVFQ